MFAFQDAYSRVNSVQLISRVWLQHTRPPCPSPTPGVYSNSRPLSRWCHPTISSSNHLILCRPLLLPPSIFPSIRIFSNESVLHIRWPKYWDSKVRGWINVLGNFFYSIRNTTVPTWMLDTFWCLMEPVEKRYKITVIYMERKINLPLPHFAIISKGTPGFAQESPGD